MSLSKYRHLRILFDDKPILEAQTADWEETARHKFVDDVPAGIGMMCSLLPIAVTCTINVRVPRGGHEYDYREAMREGSLLRIRRDDADAIADAIGHVESIKYSDNFSEDRTCTVSFKGALVQQVG